ncbi:MAG: hypothetical protein ABIH17_11365 [Pseudomonadota bacterium]
MPNTMQLPTSSLARPRSIEMVVLSAALGAVFLIVNYLHFHYIPVSVILFACVWDALIADAIVLTLYSVWRRKQGSLLLSEAGLVAIASNLLLMLYAVMGPTVIDRSLSLYIVQKVDQRGGEVAQAAMEDLFVKEYMPEFHLVDVRLTEQITSGTLVERDGCLVLTPKGRTLSHFIDWYRRTLLPQKRVLMGEVSNVLTDPFRDAKPIVDVACPSR